MRTNENSADLKRTHMKVLPIFTVLLFLFTIAACTDDAKDPLTPGTNDPKTETPETPVVEPEPASLSIGLLFHTPFDGHAHDLGPQGRMGDVTGAALTTDRFGEENQAYKFDGNDYIDYGNIQEISFGSRLPYTLAAWVKFENDNVDARQTVISKFNGGVKASWYLAINTENKIQAYRNAAPWSIIGKENVPYDEFVHLVATYDGSNYSVWFNGQLDHTISYNSHPGDTQTPVIIGGVLSGGAITPNLKGVVDDVRIYNRVLNTEELAYLANH